MTEAATARDTHVFDAALALTDHGAGRYTGHTHPAYANMVGPFGGTTAATLLRAVERHPERLGDPLSLTVNFAGPIADGPFDVAATVTRGNRSTQHWALTQTQGESVTTTATAVFGLPRPGWTSTELPLPDVPRPEDLSPAVMPVPWAQNYDLRYVTGALPDADSGERADSTSTLWVGHVPARPLDFTALAAMCDVFYPRIFLRRGAFVPAGTVSLTIYFHAPADVLAEHGDDAVLATARAAHFGNGYFDQTARLWGRGGELLATGHQLVYFKG